MLPCPRAGDARTRVCPQRVPADRDPWRIALTSSSVGGCGRRLLRHAG